MHKVILILTMKNFHFQFKIILVALLVAAIMDIAYYPVFIVQTPPGQGTMVSLLNPAPGQPQMQISVKADTLVDYIHNREPVFSTYRLGFFFTFFLFAILFYLELALCFYIVSFTRKKNNPTFTKKIFVFFCLLIISICIIFITYLNVV